MHPGAIVTTLAPFPGHVDLFVTGTDGAVWSIFFDHEMGGWQNWFLIAPEIKMYPGAKVTAFNPLEGRVDLFVTGTDGALWTNFFLSNIGWHTWILIRPEIKVQPGTTISLHQPFDGHLDLFATGTDGAVWTIFFDANEGKWSKWGVIRPEIKMQPGATVTIGHPFGSHIDLYVTGTDGAVWTTFIEEDSNWRPWMTIHPEIKMKPGATITLAGSTEDNPVLLATDTNGIVWKSVYLDGFEAWKFIRINPRMQPGAILNTESSRVYALDPHGFVWYSHLGNVPPDWWSPDAAGSAWSQILSIERMHPRGAVTALHIRKTDHNGFVEHVDLFCTGMDGTVWTTYREEGQPNNNNDHELDKVLKLIALGT